MLNISIKKNPNAIQTWLNLVGLYENAGNLDLCYEVILRAIDTVNPEAAEGKVSDIWIVYSLLLQK